MYRIDLLFNFQVNKAAPLLLVKERSSAISQERKLLEINSTTHHQEDKSGYICTSLSQDPLKSALRPGIHEDPV